MKTTVYRLIDELSLDNLTKVIKDYQSLGWKPAGKRYMVMGNHYFQTIKFEKKQKKDKHLL
jgi:hypothetical protein